MAAPRSLPSPPRPALDALQAQRVVRSLVGLFGGGEVTAWVLVTEEASVVCGRSAEGEPELTLGPVVDPTATVRRMVRGRPGTGAR